MKKWFFPAVFFAVLMIFTTAYPALADEKVLTIKNRTAEGWRVAVSIRPTSFTLTPKGALPYSVEKNVSQNDQTQLTWQDGNPIAIAAISDSEAKGCVIREVANLSMPYTLTITDDRLTLKHESGTTDCICHQIHRNNG